MQLAIFDLDGTITRRDTLVPYVLGYLIRHPWRLAGLMRVVPSLVSYFFTRDRGHLKSALIRSTLGGLERPQIDAWNARFVPSKLKRGTFRHARELIVAHRSAADRLILMSASPDLYVPAIATALGFDEVVCTEVRWENDRLSGELVTANRRGEEKVRCLADIRARHPGLRVTAYGNSASDIPHMALSESSILVNGSAAACREAALHNIRCERWR